MSYPAIYRFIDRVRGTSPNSRDFTMPASEAKALHSEITKLLLSLDSLKDSQSSLESSIEKIEVKGGNF